jgi:hypothetical protein
MRVLKGKTDQEWRKRETAFRSAPLRVPTSHRSILLNGSACPEEIRAAADAAALVRLLQQLGRHEGTLGGQRGEVVLAKNLHLLQRARQLRNQLHLQLGLGDLFLVEGKRLESCKEKA